MISIKKEVCDFGYIEFESVADEMQFFTRLSQKGFISFDDIKKDFEFRWFFSRDRYGADALKRDARALFRSAIGGNESGTRVYFHAYEGQCLMTENDIIAIAYFNDLAFSMQYKDAWCLK